MSSVTLEVACENEHTYRMEVPPQYEREQHRKFPRKCAYCGSALVAVRKGGSLQPKGPRYLGVVDVP
jgi:hypothetical protein